MPARGRKAPRRWPDPFDAHAPREGEHIGCARGTGSRFAVGHVHQELLALHVRVGTERNRGRASVVAADLELGDFEHERSAETAVLSLHEHGRARALHDPQKCGRKTPRATLRWASILAGAGPPELLPTTTTCRRGMNGNRTSEACAVRPEESRLVL